MKIWRVLSLWHSGISLCYVRVRYQRCTLENKAACLGHLINWSRAAMLLRRHRRRRAYAPTSNTASRFYHEKSDSLTVRLVALRVAGAPL